LNEVVLDASVVLKWFHSEGEGHLEQALQLRSRFEAGDLAVFAPPLLWLEIVNIAARRWRWSAERLDELARQLPSLGFEILDSELDAVARWAAAGLTAYDATYVAAAEQMGVQLVTDDGGILDIAPDLATPLSDHG
jgi:predicted nucleic acid-binding protein